MEQANKARPSLPSISSLIEAVTEQFEKGKVPSPKFDPPGRISGGSQGHSRSPDRPKASGSPRSHPPPTPDLRPASSFDFPQLSPTNISPITTPGRSNFYPPGSANTNPELYAQRASTYPPMTETGKTYPAMTDPNHWPSSHPPRLPPDIVPQDQPPRPPLAPYSEAPPEAPRSSGPKPSKEERFLHFLREIILSVPENREATPQADVAHLAECDLPLRAPGGSSASKQRVSGEEEGGRKEEQKEGDGGRAKAEGGEEQDDDGSLGVKKPKFEDPGDDENEEGHWTVQLEVGV
ncbi:uncharacterized protein Z518_01197 [Rhinocladiella mackenziei CBS 650.93]|uniref:Uncharacterized protein n=1 Tax=Rhinocladiella mackenziei CBS 650.93 TaxID=1442369 RepID=A0A0D2J372_9EURO|nr:uncharacterized protein Z518_01197 [Rhinocladiella mackenziei CBS 650.93]KIX10116.1 hypothetical protein Z518_01197 [Rhinocladiella mackenziei CBS 650.93]